MRGSALGPASCPANAQEQFANPYVAAERGYVDAVIQSRDTRQRMIAEPNVGRQAGRNFAQAT
jgi:acetyl-CoA carboxylase carboxyltransferase component